MAVRRTITLGGGSPISSATLKHLKLLREGNIYPVTAPGMPNIGPNFLAAVIARDGDDAAGKALTATNATLIELYKKALRTASLEISIDMGKGIRKPVRFIPGHRWGEGAQRYEAGDSVNVTGPCPASVMVIGKMPGIQEHRDSRQLVGESGRLFLEILRAAKIDRGCKDWYITALVRFMPPDGVTTLKRGWISDCLPLLHQELRLVRPNYILCLGTDASKALLGTKFSVSNMDGRILEYSYPVDSEPPADGVKLTTHTALVMTTMNPANVTRTPEKRRELERGLKQFCQLVDSGERFDKDELDTHHDHDIRTLAQLDDLLNEIDAYYADDPDKWIAVDAEWHGEHPQNDNAYVRTIQLSWAPKCAAAIVLNAAGGGICFTDANGKPAIKRMVKRLNAFFADKRVCGHFLVADLEWLCHLGLTMIRDRFRVPLYDKAFDDFDPAMQARLSETLGYASGDIVVAWMRTWLEGGWDTGLAAHAVEETAQLGLEALAIQYTSVPRYDLPLYAWRDKWCKDNKLKAKDLEGYGECPDEVLLPYGKYDADVTLRLLRVQWPLVDCDYDGNCCREAFWESMLTTMPILEMHQNGIAVDRDRIDNLTQIFMAARSTQEEQIKTWANWPDFNIRSVLQVREFLFGEAYNGKRDKFGRSISVRPLGARFIGVTPVMDTSKPPVPWFKVVEQGRTKEASPSTGKTVLGVLATDNQDKFQQINWIRDYRFLDQVLKTMLRPPAVDEDGNVRRESADGDGDGDTADNLGNMIYDAGLASVICDDGHVRTHMYPTTETGRWRSARPNLQNISKRRDGDYARILGPDKYKNKLRSVLKASPGHVLIEADFKSAELYVTAIQSQDDQLLDHCQRNQLAEDDPNYYDIHSGVAVLAFNLKCPPTKKGLKSIGRVALRVAAKNVIFGLLYGRGAKAVALQCREEGNPISVTEAQHIINSVFKMYPKLQPFFDACKMRSRGIVDEQDEPVASHDGTTPEQPVTARWLCNSFGRLRRFPATHDKLLAGEFERQAMNYMIQSTVASAMDRAVSYLQDYRDSELKDTGYFRILLQIHDALLVEAPYANAADVAERILPMAMTDFVSIWPVSVDGTRGDKGPYHLGVDVEMCEYWGESLTKEFCSRNGIPEKYSKD